MAHSTSSGSLELPEHWQAIWREAEAKYPDSPELQSAFNDGAHWEIARKRTTDPVIDGAGNPVV